jgi:hypothetical protein
MPAFISGIELNRRLFEEIVRPILNTAHPELQYSAALIGPGSETLGFDTEMSMDHDWGYHFFIFLKDIDTSLIDDIANLLSYKLPPSYAGFTVSIPSNTMSPAFLSKQRPLAGPIKHHIPVSTVSRFLREQLGYDSARNLRPVDWLTMPPYKLCEVVAGEVYHDGTGELATVRKQLSFYPHDIWLYMMASAWQRIGQEEHLMSRAGYAGDELGSALIGARLVRDVMDLGFLMAKVYAPYAKWFGSAFLKLKCAAELSPLLIRAQQASTWADREEALAGAYEILARMYNALGVGKKLSAFTSPFFDRPFRVIHGGDFSLALVASIMDVEVKDIASRSLLGNVSQWSDNIHINHVDKAKLREIYQ